MPAILPSRMRQTLPRQGGEAPAPEFVDQIGAGFRTAKDDIAYVQDTRLRDAYLPVMSALQDINGKSHWQYKDWLGELNPFANGGLQYDYDSVWADIVAARQKNPQAFANLPKTREEFEKGVLTRDGERQRDQQLLARGDSFVAPLIGAVGASVFDPVNLATAPIGGGSKTVGQAILREAIVNGAIELGQQVPLAIARGRMGEELTAKEAALNVGAGFLFGGALGGASKYGADNWGSIKAAPKAVQEALWAKIVPVLPENLRPKMDWDALGDDLLPDIAEAVIGRGNMSEAEIDALAVVRREIEIDSRNPYVPDGAGLKAYRDGLAEAMERIMADAPPVAPRALAVGGDVAGPSRGTMIRSTAISSGTVPGDARSVVKSRIKVVESSGNVRAKNPNSSALGPYQFLKGTWTRLYKSRYGDGGMSDAQIAALRTDPRLNEILMDDLMALNEASLRASGISPTPGNLYLAHFAGEAGAKKLHRAAPNASARSVLGDAVVDANPFLGRMSAADVIGWAERKMGGKGAPVASGARAPDIDPEADLRADIDRRMAEVEAERRALEGEGTDEPLIGPIHDGEEIPILAKPITAGEIDPIASPAVPPRTATIPADDVGDILPQLRAIVRDRTQSLNEPAKLAKALGVDEDKLRRGLTELALSREIRQNRKGQFTRLPQDSGPIDILTFVGRSGGLSEDGLDEGARKLGTLGHALGTGGRDWHKRLVPGSGALVRKTGRSIDSMGELLHEAGYFGDPQGPRPTEADVLEMLERAATQGQKIYPFGQMREAANAAEAGYGRSIFQGEDHEFYVRGLFDEAADRQAIAADDEAFLAAARIYMTEDMESMDEALLTMINREIEADRLATFYEAGEQYYDDTIEEYLQATAAARFTSDAGVDGPALYARDAGAQGATGSDAAGAAEAVEPPYLDPYSAKAFDDPEGPAATGIVDSLEHDMRAMVDPAIAERQAQLAELKAASPMQAKVDQESTIGSPLFDAVDQPQFRIDDDGDAVSATDLLAQIDEEAAIIKGIEDCL